MADPGAVTRKYLPEDRFLFFLGNTDPKKNTPRTLRGYARYRELSQHPLPLLVADLNPEAADALLREHGIEGIRPALRLPGYIPNTDLRFTAGPKHSCTLHCGRVSAYRS